MEAENLKEMNEGKQVEPKYDSGDWLVCILNKETRHETFEDAFSYFNKEYKDKLGPNQIAIATCWMRHKEEKKLSFTQVIDKAIQEGLIGEKKK